MINRRSVITAGAIAAASLAMPSMALAAGKLSYEENFYVAGSYGSYACALAKVENVGDKPIMVNAALLEVFDANGDPITSRDYFSKNAEYLQPGEYTYVCMRESLDAEQVALVDDYMLTISGKTDNTEITKRFPCTFEYKLVDEDWWSRHYVYTTVTNDTDEPVYNMGVVAGLYDVDGNLIDVLEDRLYNVAIEPGSSVTFRMEVNSWAINYCEVNGVTIGEVDAIAYVNVPNPLQ